MLPNAPLLAVGNLKVQNFRNSQSQLFDLAQINTQLYPKQIFGGASKKDKRCFQPLLPYGL